MSDVNAQVPDNRESIVTSFLRHLVEMPHWHKSLLTFAAVLFGAGLIGHVSGHFALSAPPAQSATVSNSNVPPSPTWREKLSPPAMRVGFSFIVGFVLGWLIRAFVKLMGLALGLGLVVMLALSYFHILNIDFTAARQEYTSATQWAIDQAQRFGHMVLNHLPGSTSSVFGMFLGFHRR